jgi:hypothetical protein
MRPWLATLSAISTGQRWPAYGIDFGITSDSRTLLVEVNPAYALGCFGLKEVPYSEMLEAWWLEQTTSRVGPVLPSSARSGFPGAARWRPKALLAGASGGRVPSGEEFGSSASPCSLVARFRQDPESVYNTWFRESLERLKAFRGIRRQVMEVVRTINEWTLSNDFKGSPLETVLASITEQKQVCARAAHPFYGKPKLPIPA